MNRSFVTSSVIVATLILSTSLLSPIVGFTAVVIWVLIFCLAIPFTYVVVNYIAPYCYDRSQIYLPEICLFGIHLIPASFFGLLIFVAYSIISGPIIPFQPIHPIILINSGFVYVGVVGLILTISSFTGCLAYMLVSRDID